MQSVRQFSDVSGWYDSTDPNDPTFFYEVIDQPQLETLERSSEQKLYKIVCVTRPISAPIRKQTYYVGGAILDTWLERQTKCREDILSIEQVEEIPSSENRVAQRT